MTQGRAGVAASTVTSVIDRERFPPHRAFRAREDEGSTLGASGADDDAPRGDDATEAVTSIAAADAGGDAASPNGLGGTKSLGDPS
jgi:hypothetical protein